MHRGCSNDLSDEAYETCHSDNAKTGNAKCKTCSGDNCNEDIYPANRRRCNRCDSSEYNTCVSDAVSFSSICPIYDENDECVTKIVDNNLVRGCASELPCDSADPFEQSKCYKCKTNNCNTVDLLLLDFGEPGKFQDLPLNCYQCKGRDCPGTISLCADNKYQNCMTVLDEENNVIERGCSSVVMANNGDYCLQNPEKCLTCKSNGCNDYMPKEDKLIDCYFCDTNNDMSCMLDFNSRIARKRKCRDHCMVAVYKHPDGHSGYDLIRSCLDDMDIDERESCLKKDDNNCMACSDPLCNTQSLSLKHHSCFTCKNSGECEDPYEQLCPLYDTNDQCYILSNEGDVREMGCRSSLRAYEIDYLKKERKLWLCEGANCNNPDHFPTPKQCSVCNSRDNPACVTSSNTVENVQRCSTFPFTDCYTRIDKGKYLSIFPNLID